METKLEVSFYVFWGLSSDIFTSRTKKNRKVQDFEQKLAQREAD